MKRLTRPKDAWEGRPAYEIPDACSITGKKGKNRRKPVSRNWKKGVPIGKRNLESRNSRSRNWIRKSTYCKGS